MLIFNTIIIVRNPKLFCWKKNEKIKNYYIDDHNSMYV